MNIIVTGASRGIGYETVKLLAQYGDNTLFAVSRNRKNLQKLVKETQAANFQSEIIPLPYDLSTAEGLKSIKAEILKRTKHIDAIINNAGHIVNKPFANISAKELQQVYTVNVFAPFLLLQQLIPFMGKRSRGHIVNISSMGGVQGSAKFSGLSAYSSSKAAIAGLSECLAEELREKNISVNCLAIGAVQTEMLEKAFPGYKAPLSPSEMAEYIAHFTTTGHQFYNGKILPVSSTTP